MSADLDQLAFRFFKLFARFEATLKEREFSRVESGRIVVQWDRFANEVVGDGFLADLGDKADSAGYILDDPPKKQDQTRKARSFGSMSPPTTSRPKRCLATSAA